MLSKNRSVLLLKPIYQKTTTCLGPKELRTLTKSLLVLWTTLGLSTDTETMAPTEDYYNTYHITKRIQTNAMYILSTFWIRPSKI